MEVAMRRHAAYTDPLDERLAQEAKRLKEAAKSLKPGKRRQEIMRKAQQAEMAAGITFWISSPGLPPPE
jgi:hypothetical protein